MAGTVEEGETYASNVLKEAAEELGLTAIRPREGPKVLTRTQWTYFCQWFTLTLDRPAEAFHLQADEVAAVRWVARTALEAEFAAHPERFLRGLPRWLALLP